MREYGTISCTCSRKANGAMLVAYIHRLSAGIDSRRHGWPPPSRVRLDRSGSLEVEPAQRSRAGRELPKSKGIMNGPLLPVPTGVTGRFAEHAQEEYGRGQFYWQGS